MNVFEQLRLRCQPFITAYVEDLEVHDRAQIGANPGIPFLHWTRKWGTHILFLYPHNHAKWPANNQTAEYIFGQATREHILRDSVTIADYAIMKMEGLRCVHHYHPAGLPGCGPEHLDEITCGVAAVVAREYADAVSRAWITAAAAPRHSS